MKRLFGSRPDIEDEIDFDDDPLDFDYDDYDPERDVDPLEREDETARLGNGDLAAPAVARPTAGLLVADREGDPVDDVGADHELDDLVDPRSGDLERQRRSEALAEQRSAWAYLAALGGLFCFLLIFGYACSEQRGSEVAGTDAVELIVGSEPSRLLFRIDGDVVAIQGSIPDQAAKDQLVAAAQQTYGAENVVDELTVDPDTTLDSGTVRFIGSATFGDERPEALQEAVGSTFGLANRGFEVGFVETVLAPVSAELAITDGTVALTGELPDEQSVADLVAIAGEVWGPQSVDGAGLSVGATTWTDGSIRVTGSTSTTDERVATFTGLVASRIGTLVAVDTAALALIDNSARIGEIQAAVDELVTTSPIQFSPDSPELSAESDAVLVELAAALNELPDIPFEVVGHTDSVGPDADNLVLSQERAAAVVARLTELGVDPARMTSRGEGEENPIAENDTDEGRAANRRIEFVLIGTSAAE